VEDRQLDNLTRMDKYLKWPYAFTARELMDMTEDDFTRMDTVLVIDAKIDELEELIEETDVLDPLYSKAYAEIVDMQRKRNALVPG